MPDKLQIPHSFKRLSDAINIHLSVFETKHPDNFTYAREKEGFGIESFPFRFARRVYGWTGDGVDLGFIRLRQLNTNLTEMVMEDSSALEVGPNLFLTSDLKLWEDEEELVKVPFKKRKAEAATKFERFKAIHQEIRESVIDGLREDHLLSEKQKLPATKSQDAYVDKSRIAQLRQVRSPKFDLARLIRLCEELIRCFTSNSFCATAALVRAIIDHVPPVFGARSFAEVANNVGEKSIKASLQRLETSSRNIADSVLHQQIRKREVVPNKTQVNFSNDLDLLLGEILRRLT